MEHRASRIVWAWAVAVLVALLLVSCGEADGGEADGGEARRAAPVDARPNFVFVLVDDMAPGMLRFMPKTRALIGDRGLTFKNAFLTDPLCCPSRATLLTGRYAHSHGTLFNGGRHGGMSVIQDNGLVQDTIATRLHEAGYKTALVGKYGGPRCGDSKPPGWDRWFAFAAGLNRDDSYEVCDQNEHRTISRERWHETDLLAEKAEIWIERNADAPYLLWLAPHAPHNPYGELYTAKRHRHEFDGAQLPDKPSINEVAVSDKPRYTREKSRRYADNMERLRSAYEGKLEALATVDAMMRRLDAALERTGQTERTYVVFMSDNGYLLGEHRLSGKQLPYEESIGTPLIVRGPGIPAGERRSQIVANNDVPVTIADLAGVEPPAGAEGRSLAPLFDTSEATEAWRDALLLESYTKGGKLSWSGVRTPTHTYVEYANGEKELYDLRADPYQLHNVAGQMSELEAQLSARLQRLVNCSGGECRAAEGP